jgi:hypothetical protein
MKGDFTLISKALATNFDSFVKLLVSAIMSHIYSSCEFKIPTPNT